MEETFMRFSYSGRYLYLINEREELVIYEVKDKKEEIIMKSVFCQRLPEQYEVIINIGFNENDVMNTLLACKKKDFRNIDIFPLEFMVQANDILQQDGLGSLKKKSQYSELCEEYNINTIRIPQFDIDKLKLKFSQDLTSVIYCTEESNFILELGNEHKK
jgi:hypothetical protein